MNIKGILAEIGGDGMQGAEAVIKNLKELDASRIAAEELRYTQISELWRLIRSKERYADTDRTIAIISNLFSGKAPKKIDISSSGHMLSEYLYTDSHITELSDKALICFMASEMLLNSDTFSYEDILGYFDDVDTQIEGKIACVRSEYIENAYASLSSAVTNPKVSYFQSYGDVAEAVYNGIAEYCILPTYNDVEGKLRGFYSLINKYELKICSICEQISDNKGMPSITQYALLKKGLDVVTNKERLEVVLSSESVFNVAEAIGFAEIFGVETLRIDSSLDGTFSLVFDIKGKEILPFLLYLAASFTSFIPIGLYSSVSTK